MFEGVQEMKNTVKFVQIIPTSAKVTPNVGLLLESLLQPASLFSGISYLPKKLKSKKKTKTANNSRFFWFGAGKFTCVFSRC